MKNILKITSCIFCFLIFVSCETDRDPVPSANGFELRATTLAPTVILSPANDNDVIADLNWDLSDNGFNSISSYKVEIAVNGTNFANVATANSGNDIEITPEIRNYKLKAGELNALINKLPEFESQCGREMNIDIRIKSILGGKKPNAFVQYSNPITVRVTPYSTAKSLLAFTTDLSLAATADKLVSSAFTSASDYQGFFYLTPGTYKFYKPDTCNGFSSPTVYGTNGTNTGALDATGTTGFQVTTAGKYFIKVNLNTTGTGAMTYTISDLNGTTPTLGIFGGATRAVGFSNITPMVYDVASNTWKLTIELINGKKFGFKTNNGGSPLVVLKGAGSGSSEVSPLTPIDGPLTSANYSDGTILTPGNYVDAATKTKYDVVVDVSKAREYTYQLIPNPN